MLPIDLIIFDLDGTLLNTPPNIGWSVNQMLRELGLPAKPVREIYGYIGIGIDHLLNNCLGPNNMRLYEKAHRTFIRIQRENYTYKVVVYPGVRQMLEFFKKKIKIVVSNKNYFITRLSLEHFGLAAYFKKIFGGDAPHLRKPVNTKIKKILSDFGVRPQRALMIGDMTIDIATGHNSGIHTCAVTYGLGQLAELEAARPDFIIQRAAELKKLIF